MTGSAATIANARPPSEVIASSSAVRRVARSSRSRSAGQEAAITGASVVNTEIGTKCACSSRLYTAPYSPAAPLPAITNTIT